ncbi:MAG: hypothetical protein WB992_00540 [Bryobacteraceae bacterium]
MAVTAFTELQFFWQKRSVHSDFRAGVSLHSHTMYSEENLNVVPRWIIGAVSVSHAVGRGVSPDLRNAFWTPPLNPRQAYRLEEKQIHTQFQLPALVSLTDHDNVRAGSRLRVLDRFHLAPISTEWTIPFGPTFFHLGVHNIPPENAGAIIEQLNSFTADPEHSALPALLDMLNFHPNLLLVLNHPLWDEKGIGQSAHQEALRCLLQSQGLRLHALELNGLRSWQENDRVLKLAQEVNLPVVAGGDRHGLEPNAILNLSRSLTLAEFVEEIRYRRFSHVVFMPQYRQPRKLRILRMIVDILRDYKDLEDRRSWTDRVFGRDPVTGAAISFASLSARHAAAEIREYLVRDR